MNAPGFPLILIAVGILLWSHYGGPKHPGNGSAADDENPNTPWHKAMDKRIEHHNRGTTACIVGIVLVAIAFALGRG